jgi:predicted lipid-binding transport protein (Tim44 family)
MQGLRSLVAFAALALALLLGADDADARLGDSSGLERKVEGLAMAPSVAAPTFVVAAVDHPAPGAPPSPGSLGGLFNRGGVIGGFAAGFLGSGVLGLLFGHGVIGELGSVASFFGLLFQLTLIAMLAYLIWSWWTGRNQPAFSGLSPRELADPYLRTRHELAPGAEQSTESDDHGGAANKHSANA